MCDATSSLSKWRGCKFVEVRPPWYYISNSNMQHLYCSSVSLSSLVLRWMALEVRAPSLLTSVVLAVHRRQGGGVVLSRHRSRQCPHVNVL